MNKVYRNGKVVEVVLDPGEQHYLRHLNAKEAERFNREQNKAEGQGSTGVQNTATKATA